MNDEWRVQFDAEVTFANGGRLVVEGFRLDVPGRSIDDAELGVLFVRHLGLLMVDEVRVSGKEMLQEMHKGSRGVESATVKRRLVELSHVIEAGMTTYPGLPGPEIDDHLSREDSRGSYAPGTEFLISRVSMVGNTGTYVDSPYHRYADGRDLSQVPLERFADLDALVVRVPDGVRAVDRLLLAPYEMAGRAVLIHTGWDRHWRTEAYGSGAHPYLTGDGAAWLVERDAALVGIDSLNIDATTTGSRPAHSTLLAAGIPIVEHLSNLGALPPSGFRFHAVPLSMVGVASFPVRAFAVIS